MRVGLFLAVDMTDPRRPNASSPSIGREAGTWVLSRVDGSKRASSPAKGPGRAVRLTARADVLLLSLDATPDQVVVLHVPTGNGFLYLSGPPRRSVQIPPHTWTGLTFR